MMSEVADETFVINLKMRQWSTSLQRYNHLHYNFY